MSTHELTFIEELILLELSAAKAESALSRSDLLNPALRPAAAGLLPALERLTSGGLIEQIPLAPRQRTKRWRIQPPGRDALHHSLGGAPSTRSRTWKQKAARTLAAIRFLHLPARTAAALVEESALPVYFLAARLGEEYTPSTTLDVLARRTSAGALGLSNDQPESLWRAIFDRALAGQSTFSTPSTPLTLSSPSDAFPSQVHHAARIAQEGWFGPRKLFIHRAWQAWQSATGETADLLTFKARLLDALRAGDIGLTRADFTVDLDPADLERAEIKYGQEVFHFVTFQQDTKP
jgi:hypothetical protein